MTAKKHLELARWACDQAQREGAQEVRASVNRSRTSSLEYRERKVETLEESTVKGLNLSFYIDGRYSAHRTSDLRKDAIQKFVTDAVAMTRHLTEDPFRRLPEPELYEGRETMDLQLADPGHASVVPEDRHEVARTIEQAALERGGDKIISVTAGYTEIVSESAMVATNGFEGYRDQTNFWCGAECTAKDEGDKRPEDWWWEGQRHRGDLSNVAAIGQKAVDRALSRRGADKVATEEYAVIVENRAARRLIGFYSGAFRGRNLQQKRSFLEGKQGEKIASKHLTIVDDPFIKRGQASRLYDNEGISAKRMPMLEQGVLRNFYIDTYYGRKLDMRPTTGSASNVTFESDRVRSVEAWMKELDRGILITGFLGGNSNSSTGDFSTGIQGFLFEGGSIKQPIAAMNIAGNHLEFWHKLQGLGDDPYPFGSVRTPSLVFEPMVLAGT
jgi:PmbA protein